MTNVEEVYNAAVGKFVDKLTQCPEVDPDEVRRSLALNPSSRSSAAPKSKAPAKVKSSTPAPNPKKKLAMPCQAFTRQKRPCAKRSTDGSGFCQSHLKAQTRMVESQEAVQKEMGQAPDGNPEGTPEVARDEMQDDILDKTDNGLIYEPLDNEPLENEPLENEPSDPGE